MTTPAVSLTPTGAVSSTPTGAVSSTPTGAVSPDPVLAARQDALAGEYAAAFGYGTLGPKLSAAAQVTLAHQCEAAHRSTAAFVSQQLVGEGVVPVQPAANYPLPFPLGDASAATQLALRLETAAASAWRYLISLPTAPAAVRETALTALTDSAVRAVRWRAVITPSAPTVPFPGI